MEKFIDDIMEGLNERQRDAVKKTEGPLLVLAGAGSGKTRVLVSRIAYILSKNYAKPWEILAITFTNKAANEMKNRVKSLVGNDCSGMWIGTFHATCARILRSTIELLGYSSDFIIYDAADTKTLIKECLAELNIDEKSFAPRAVLSVISNAKNDMMDVNAFEEEYKNDYRMTVIAGIYRLYQKKMRENDAVDFDDLIFLTVQILSKNPDVLLKYQDIFHYIMVDEYQDTNNSQYMLIRLLSGGYNNVCVVGDEDQSIYGFRGANIDNILNFQKDFKDAEVIKLEQNYRSTQTILNSANSVINNNNERIGKTLWTDNGNGDKIIIHTASNEYDEGRYIADEINKHYKETGSYKDCAILYRMNAQSRAIEEIFMRENVPYKVFAGLRFYDRKEIKDVVAYLRLVHNTGDDLSLKRIINEPKRKIGNATMDKAQAIADRYGCNLFDVVSGAEDYPELSVAAPRLTAFARMIEGLVSIKDKVPVSELLETLLDESGYRDALMNENTVENRTRLDNISEFMSVVKEFENNESYDGTLAEFLTGISLVSDMDSDDDEDCVSLMTIHSSKGLEFPVVFIAGFEEGLFPGPRSLGDDKSIEEERRLCYVAMTRAEKRLYITKTVSRTIFGKTSPTFESRFLKEIPDDYSDKTENVTTEIAETAAKLGIFSTPTRVNAVKEKMKLSKSRERYKTGDIVEHRKFGRGQIINVKNFGDDAMLYIDFESCGTKQLMANFAKLEKIK